MITGIGKGDILPSASDYAVFRATQLFRVRARALRRRRWALKYALHCLLLLASWAQTFIN